MTEIQKALVSISDKKYKEFQAKLCPNISPEKLLGVRVPMLREYAKTLTNQREIDEFLSTLPHEYYDENMLHSVLLTKEKPFNKCVEDVEKFLPYVDNWAVCDILNPKVFKKNKPELLEKIKCWVKSDREYTIRFGVEMLMNHFLDADFSEEYVDIPLGVKSDEYYVKMMVAWFYATALSKQWEKTIPVLKNKKLPVWTHNKTIQKAVESYRITESQKEYLRSLKIEGKK